MRMSLILILAGSLAILFGVLFIAVWVPGALVFHPPQTLVAHEFTPQEYRGYVLYYSNGCNYCHTLYSRFWDNSGWPRAQAGDYNFYNPLILGSERTGPDLSYIGRKRSIAWLIEHERHPRNFSPNSIMPDWDFLPDSDLQDVATFLFGLGDRVAGEQMIPPPAPYTGYVNPLPLPQATPVPNMGPNGWPTWLEAGLQEGKELFMARCFTCHGCAGNGLGHYASKLFITPASFRVEPFKDMTDAEWFWHIKEGVPGTVMPVWKDSDLTDDQIWSIIRYDQNTFAHPIMRDPDEGPVDNTNPAAAPYVGLTNPLPLTVAVLEEAKAIYLRECMICHNDSGDGNGDYGLGLQPPPADFHDPAHYNDYSDADWFWRLREGLPWSAMPSWKIVYSADDLWKLVHYLRVTFAMTEPRPPTEGTQAYPGIYLEQQMPASGVSYLEGQRVYLNNCAKCHGLDGTGNGWSGQYLVPPPANFTDPLMNGNTDGMWFALTSLGVQNSAMPVWNEFLFEGQRWAAIKYIVAAFVEGRPVNRSLAQDQAVAVNVLTLSPQNWLDAGNTISPSDGQVVYNTYCANCHGDQGQGHGPGTVGTPSGGPAPFPAQMDPTYAFWRTLNGVPELESTMPPFGELRILAEQDIWDVTSYLAVLTGSTLATGG